MGKRSSFERVERDFYRTPLKAVEPLIPHLPNSADFLEPCAGDGALLDHIENLTNNRIYGTSAYDIEPQRRDIGKRDFFDLEKKNFDSMMVITNPPWDRKFLHPMIERLVEFGVTSWLLFDADWAHTVQAAPYLPHCDKIVSVGRVKWIEDSKNSGKDNCAWYKFGPAKTPFIKFYGRT